MTLEEQKSDNAVEIYYEAQRLRTEGDPNAALDRYHECLELLYRQKDVLGQIRVLMEMAELFEERGTHSKAMACLKACLDYANDIGQEYEKSVVLHRMGHLLFRMGENEKAVHRFEESSFISRSLGDQRGYALSRAMLGKILLSKGEVNEGLGLMVESLAVLHSINAQEWDTLREQIRSYGTKLPRSMYEFIVRTKTDRPGIISLLLS